VIRIPETKHAILRTLPRRQEVEEALEKPSREAPAPRKKRDLFVQVYDKMDALVDYSELTNMDASLSVDYSELATRIRKVSEESRGNVVTRMTR
jgi:hypothetical protein